MAARVRYDAVDVGTELPPAVFTVTRLDLVRYAGASEDFNPIHWREQSALDAGLPDVIAHGMLTMGSAARVLTDWLGDPGAILEYGVRFTKPVVVPDGVEVPVEVTARVIAKLDDRRVRIALTASHLGVKVLSAAYAIVQLT